MRGNGFVYGRAYYPKNGGDGGGVRLVSAARPVVIVVVGTSLPAPPCRPVTGLRGRRAGSARPPCHGYAWPAGQRARLSGHAHRTRRPALLAGRLSCSFTPPPTLCAQDSTTPPHVHHSLTRSRALAIPSVLLLLFFSCSSLLLLHLNTSRSTPPLHNRLLFTYT